MQRQRQSLSVFSDVSSHSSNSTSEPIESPLTSPKLKYRPPASPDRVDIDKGALPLDSLVLVTGANGWLGMHVVDQLLRYGYRVRGTVRDLEKAVWTSKYFWDNYGPERYSVAVVPDMTPRGAFDAAIRGCAGVVHLASVMSWSSDPEEVITPTLAGALNILEAAAGEPEMLRFVYCSAAAAAATYQSGRVEEVTSESWNMASFGEAWDLPPYGPERAWAVYCSSKVQTEQAVWTWIDKAKERPFTVNTILPGTLWGRMLDPVNQGFRTSVGQLKGIFDGRAADATWAPPQHFVDVQDAAALHVAALALPDVQQQRIFAVSSPYTVNLVLQMLRALYPGKIVSENARDQRINATVFSEAPRAQVMLKRLGRDGWTDLMTSVTRNCQSFM
ncbi:aldehyde reductase [Piedraia hortae CBS 480.64]|uniref:Aldehyde reductase n=1 Tax=Piedraia hortae CBS 480.64 TaxID=1314780 RepID=A0A6A7BWN3_9PEZI|nr:aldehyde reductase [Piedraia hortae CBS 480.64]